ncbi:MAG: adenine phosphoribosyltransferase [Acholeplasmatales bacterium]|nr:adenine phosphoribosyltransferase [Acholeplasmatales bacterium]
MELKDYIASIVDFPKKGIIFRDVTPLMENGKAFDYATHLLAEYAKEKGATHIVGPESRGFIFGCPVAKELGIGFIPVRKPGKLPRAQITEDYALEYGTNTLCMHEDSLKKGDKVVIIDDLLATGGTALATAHLCEKSGAEVLGMAFIIDLIDLKGREVLKDYDVHTLIEFEGE